MICSHTRVVPNLWLICNLKRRRMVLHPFLLDAARTWAEDYHGTLRKWWVSTTESPQQVSFFKWSMLNSQGVHQIWDFPGPPPVISWGFKRPIYSWSLQLPRRNFHGNTNGSVNKLTLPKVQQPRCVNFREISSSWWFKSWPFWDG